jgi:hypothetical protein
MCVPLRVSLTVNSYGSLTTPVDGSLSRIFPRMLLPGCVLPSGFLSPCTHSYGSLTTLLMAPSPGCHGSLTTVPYDPLTRVSYGSLTRVSHTSLVRVCYGSLTRVHHGSLTTWFRVSPPTCPTAPSPGYLMDHHFALELSPRLAFTLPHQWSATAFSYGLLALLAGYNL